MNNILTIDTETELIAPGQQAPRLVCVAFSYQGVRWLKKWDDFIKDFIDLLSLNVFIVGHNIAFDMAVLANAEPGLLPLIFDLYEKDRITDTKIREQLHDIALGRHRGFTGLDGRVIKLNYSLDDLARRRLNRKLDKDTWRLRYAELRDVPLSEWPEGARHYPLEDVRATEDVYLSQSNQYLDDQYRQTRAAFWIYLMTAWGIHTDTKAVAELARRTAQDYERIAFDLRQAGLLRPDTRSKKRNGAVEIKKGTRDTKKAAELLALAYRRIGQEPPRTDSGAIALDEKSCRESDDPLLLKYAEFSSLGAVLAKDVPALEQGTSAPIHSRFESLLETGRTSSSAPNIQNPKRRGGIRECFVPRPGCVFAACDYSGAELGTLAQVCLSLLGDSALAAALNSGKDPHLIVAQGILHRPYDDLKKIKNQGAGPDCQSKTGKCSCTYCIVDNARQTGKVANFGFPGGLGAKTLIEFANALYGVELTEQDARQLKKVWVDMWPEMKHYFAYVDSTVKSGQPIKQLFSGRYRGDLSYTARCNTLFQGLAADMAKAAGFAIAKACYVGPGPLLGSRLVNFVHDEFILEVPELGGHEAATHLAELMRRAARQWCPDVRIDSQPLLMRRWSKNAKQVFENGRLVPWT